MVVHAEGSHVQDGVLVLESPCQQVDGVTTRCAVAAQVVTDGGGVRLVWPGGVAP